jgi:hypothetical protein
MADKSNIQGLDPFSQFLATAFLQGRMPGNQTSAFNTVLDLMGPGAVAGRAEAGQPDVLEQFASMFGGMSLTPEETEQMLKQQAGLQLTPQQAITGKAELAKGMGSLMEAITTGRFKETELGIREREAGVKEREASVKEDAQAMAADKALVDAAWKKALTGEAQARTEKIKGTSSAEQAMNQQMQLTALAMGWGGVDEKGNLVRTDAPVDPQDQQMAQKILGAFQRDPEGWMGISALLRTKNASDRALALGLIQRLNPGLFSIEDISYFSSRLDPVLAIQGGQVPTKQTDTRTRSSLRDKPAGGTELPPQGLEHPAPVSGSDPAPAPGADMTQDEFRESLLKWLNPEDLERLKALQRQ